MRLIIGGSSPFSLGHKRRGLLYGAIASGGVGTVRRTASHTGTDGMVLEADFSRLMWGIDATFVIRDFKLRTRGMFQAFGRVVMNLPTAISASIKPKPEALSSQLHAVEVTEPSTSVSQTSWNHIKYEQNAKALYARE